MPGVGVHRGDHPVLGNPARDPEHPVLAEVEVLAQHRGQQRRSLPDRLVQLAPVQYRQDRVPVPRPGGDQLLAGARVVPVDLRLPRRDVVVTTRQRRPQRERQIGIGRLEQPPQRRADQRDGVHRGHRVIQRRRVQHPAPTHQPGRPGRLQTHLEDPVRAPRTAQPLPHVHQHRVREPGPPRPVVPPDTRRIAPSGVEAVPIDRLPIREPFQTLQGHHRGHHRRRHRPPTGPGEQIGEQLIREQPVPLPRQEPVDRVRRQRLLAKPGHLVEQITLTISTPQRHPPILPQSITHPDDRHAKDTSHLGRR